ncbi:hypothetical protein T484DRAFT_1922875, partial [Baffinella frigidus]
SRRTARPTSSAPTTSLSCRATCCAPTRPPRRSRRWRVAGALPSARATSSATLRPPRPTSLPSCLRWCLASRRQAGLSGSWLRGGGVGWRLCRNARGAPIRSPLRRRRWFRGFIGVASSQRRWRW